MTLSPIQLEILRDHAQRPGLESLAPPHAVTELVALGYLRRITVLTEKGAAAVKDAEERR